jgi:hypothetical protein
VLEGEWFKEDFRSSFPEKVFRARRKDSYLDNDYQNIGKGV